MVDVLLARYRIEPGETDRLRKWFEVIRDRPFDLDELLEREGMLTESLFVHESGDGDELWWYQEAEDIEQVLAVFEAEVGDVVEASKALLDDVLVDGIEEPVEIVEPFFHVVNPAR